jgi:predicted RNA binding protein YcfA (HicA-like mRNA interferase family)
MSKKDKLLKAIKNNPKDVRFEDLKKLLLSHGYAAHNTGGSHWVFRKAGFPDEVVPYKKPVKAMGASKNSSYPQHRKLLSVQGTRLKA